MKLIGYDKKNVGKIILLTVALDADNVCYTCKHTSLCTLHEWWVTRYNE